MSFARIRGLCRRNEEGVVKEWLEEYRDETIMAAITLAISPFAYCLGLQYGEYLNWIAWIIKPIAYVGQWFCGC